MSVVMPALLPSSDAQPFLSMVRFETGESGNPHSHGFAVGAGAPRVGRVHGDVLADPQGDRGENSDDDGLEPVQAKLEETDVQDVPSSVAEVAGGGGSDLSDSSVELVCGVAGADAAVPPPPAPSSEPRPKRKRELRQRSTEARLPDSGALQGVGVQKLSHLELDFAKYFCDLVSEWNSC